MISVLWTKVSIRMHPENFEGIQTSSEAVILPKAQISHNQKPGKVAFWKGNGTSYFQGNLQGGPPTSYNWVEITPITRVIRTGSHLFSAIYRGPITPFITARGPPCRLVNIIFWPDELHQNVSADLKQDRSASACRIQLKESYCDICFFISHRSACMNLGLF